MPATQLHRIINILARSNALFQRANLIKQIRHQQSVHDKSRRIVRPHRRLPQLCAKPHHLVVHCRVRRNRPHHFHQLHHRHRIKKVHLHKPLRPLRRSRNLRNRQRRSIARKNCARWAKLVERAKQFPFRRKLLDDRFNHQIAAFQIFYRRSAFQSPPNLALRRLGNRSLFDQPRQILLNPLQSFFHQLRRHFPHHRLKSRRRAHLRDSRPHQPTPNHSHLLNYHDFLADTAVEPLRPGLESLPESLWSAAARRRFCGAATPQVSTRPLRTQSRSLLPSLLCALCELSALCVILSFFSVISTFPPPPPPHHPQSR